MSMPADFDPDALEGRKTFIRLGHAAGLQQRSVIGHSDAVGTTEGSLYSEHDTAAIHSNVMDHFASPGIVYVASTSSNDADGGTGAQEVLLTGIHQNGSEASEVITLDGQNIVESSTSFKVVTSIDVMAAGTLGQNEGVVWVGADNSFTAGVPDLPLNACGATTNQSSTAILAVPRNKRWVPTQLSLMAGEINSNQDLIYQIILRDNSTGLVYEILDLHSRLTGNGVTLPMECVEPLEALDLMMIRVAVSAGTASVTTMLDGILVDVV